ncbi:MAG: hypothetical protein MK066_13205, partial [Crocinitomicaceae bacterium]|nr:hypothetical protein [Crocinitomicaceae bacterium]
SGCAVAGLDWWNEREKKRHSDWKRFFPPMQSFMDDVDFEKVNYTVVRERRGVPYIAQRWPFERDDVLRSNTKPYRKSDKLEAYTQLDSLATQGFGWMMNRSYNWHNLKDSMDCIAALVNGTEPFAKPYLYESIDNDKVNAPITIEEGDAYIKVYNVKRRTRYTIDFYNTETGKVSFSKEIKSSLLGVLKIYPPTLNPKDQYDIAYKFYETAEGWR